MVTISKKFASSLGLTFNLVLLKQIFIIIFIQLKLTTICNTGKYLSEDLIFASTNPQYDDRLFTELPVHYMKTTSAEHQKNMLCTYINYSECQNKKNNLCTQHVLLMFWAGSFHVLTELVFQWTIFCHIVV